MNLFHIIDDAQATSNPNVSWEALDGVSTTTGELGVPYVD